MTQEEKQLVFKDLCARFPYDVKICVGFNTKSSYTANIITIYANKDYIQIRPKDLHIHTAVRIEDIKPYLRSLSNMTKEEKDELFQLMGNGNDVQRMEFYHSHYLDCYGMIGKGLALEAPNDMYNL